MWFLLTWPGTGISCRFCFRLYTHGKTKGYPAMLIKEISHPDSAAELLISSPRRKIFSTHEQAVPCWDEAEGDGWRVGATEAWDRQTPVRSTAALQWIRGLNNAEIIEVTHPAHTRAPLHPHGPPELPSAAANQTSNDVRWVGKKKPKCDCKRIHLLKPRLPEGETERVGSFRRAVTRAEQ